MAEEKTLSSKVIHDGHIKLRIDTIQLPDGEISTREIVEHPEVVAIVAVDDRDNVLMVRQFRRAAGQELLEIPAGGIDGEETPEEAVRREMQEETGYLPRKIEKLGGFYSAPGFCTEYMHLFLATDLTPSRLSAEDTDSIRLERLPISEIPKLVALRELHDGKSIAGLLTFLEYRKRH
ncbi:MAG: NUDIX hydrolase [Chloroflexi bacterium]|nr:NUDIX hydrolase [Chloroflexota bacterium]